jgi:hypothetical protein
VAGQPVVAVEVEVTCQETDRWPQPWRDLRAPALDPEPSQRSTLQAIPYALWANRGPSTLRVNLPLTRAGLTPVA